MAAATALAPAFSGYTNVSQGRFSRRDKGGREASAQLPSRGRAEKQLCDFDEGDLIDGTVTQVTESGVLVDVGMPEDALIPQHEAGSVLPLVGDQLQDLRVAHVDTELSRLELSLLDARCSGEIDFLAGFQHDPVIPREVPGRGGMGKVKGKGKGKGRSHSKGMGLERTDVLLEDLYAGQEVTGVVKSVTSIGIFVDIGAVTDGLIHSTCVPEGANYEKGDQLEDLSILSIDLDRQRFSLAFVEEDSEGETRLVQPRKGRGKGSFKGKRQRYGRPLADLSMYEELTGEVVNVCRFGVFINVGATENGLLRNRDIPEGVVYEKGDAVDGLCVMGIDTQKGQLALGLLEEDSEGEMHPPPHRGPILGQAKDDPASYSGIHDANDRAYGSDSSTFRTSARKHDRRREGTPRVTHSRSRPNDTPYLQALMSGMESYESSMYGSAAPGPCFYDDLEDSNGGDGSSMGDSESENSEDPIPQEIPQQSKAELRSQLRLSGPQPGKNCVARSQAQEELEADDYFSDLAPGLKTWLARLQPEDAGNLGVAEQRRNAAADDGEGSVDDDDILESLQCLSVGDAVEGTVTRTTEQGAFVNFEYPVEGFLPRHLITWYVRVGDELQDLVISHIDLARRHVTLGFNDSRVHSSNGAGQSHRDRGQDRRDGTEEIAYWGENEDRGPAAQVSEELVPLLSKIFLGDRGAGRGLATAVVASGRPIQACFNATGALKVLMRYSRCGVAALLGMEELCEQLGRAAEPFLAKAIPAILDRYGDRQHAVQLAAEDAAETIITSMNPYGIDSVLPAVLGVLQRRERTQVKSRVLRLLALMRDEDQMRPLARRMADITPYIVDMLNDVKSEFREAAREVAVELFQCAQNLDLDPYLETIIDALMDQKAVPACINQLSEIVFEQPVEAQALAVIIPLIKSGLRVRDEQTKCKALAIIDSMCKLIPDASEIRPFLGVLVPLVKRAKDHISNAAALRVADHCLSTLDAAERSDYKKVLDKAAIRKILDSKIPQEKHEGVTELLVDYVADLCKTMSACRVFERAEWGQCITPYLTPHLLSTAECNKLVPILLEKCYDATEVDDVENKAEGETDLCDCVFSLGYGLKTLLMNARLHLRRGMCYGLVGSNSCGKSTLLRAIYNEHLSGFPPKAEVITTLVEHEIGEQEPECTWTPLEYMYADKLIEAMQIPRKKVIAALRSLGFNNHQMKSQIAHLSGGWKMKLGLVRAMLVCPDILLLDEPTGHLDEDNVAWLCNYIRSLKADRAGTTIVVSHDTAFLNEVCTHIISMKQRKLKTYVGNITDFARRQPDAKSYLSLTGGKLKFVLPEPGMLEGTRAGSQRLLKMQHVSYTYPGNDEPTLSNVSIEASMESRLALIGPNGSGKSTLIKVLLGELPIARGGQSSVWKHPGLRIAHVAQHAFCHIEEHLEKTATQYLLWRFENDEDRLAPSFEADKNVQQKRHHYYFEDGELTRVMDSNNRHKSVVPEKLLGRRRVAQPAGGSEEECYEYHVQWLGLPAEMATWVARGVLVDMGALPEIQREDEDSSIIHCSLPRPLTQQHVEEHLVSFGLDASSASHMRLGVFSGGQKIRVLLGAAMWLSPHILILDEPANYLDREALGALAAALKEFNGGVIIVSHNREFCAHVCTEWWIMNGGRLTRDVVFEDTDVRSDSDEEATQQPQVHHKHRRSAAREEAADG